MFLIRKWTCIAVWCLAAIPSAYAKDSVAVYFDNGSKPLTLLTNRVKNHAAQRGAVVSVGSLDGLPPTGGIVVLQQDKPQSGLSRRLQKVNRDTLEPEGYALKWHKPSERLYVIGADSIGAQYGLREVLDHWLAHGTIRSMKEKTANPLLEYRILKFNLPWSPYRKNEATDVHLGVCRDLAFWERFLDMMVDNRFNVLSLWNNHPFPFMVRSASFPKATPFSDDELADWKQFWTALFRMAKDRGIQTFVVNWNIVVSPEFAEAYGASEYNDRSPMVAAYTRESVRQLIDEYPDLTGIGVTLADWMGNFPDAMSPQEREDWIASTFVQGMKEASRPVKFLHRSVLAGDPMAMRNLLDNAGLEEPALVEIKFNWSHGHSTPQLAITHDFHSGELDSRFWEPEPESYRIQWMVRNEDFFILRWGQADFIRTHILQNKLDVVNGYFIGSEGYIPALDYASLPGPDRTWHYAFEKQWLFYTLWGRLLYDPHTPDTVFEDQLAVRYGRPLAAELFSLYQLASQLPLRLASFYRSTWDYTLYSEGFIAAEPANPKAPFDRSSPFISIAELLSHDVLDSNLMAIKMYVTKTLQGGLDTAKTTPTELARQSETDSRAALALIAGIRQRIPHHRGALVSELDDMATWAYLGLYFADKIRAGVALEFLQQTGEEAKRTEAIQLLQRCVEHWDGVIFHTKGRYLPVPHVATEYYGDEFKTFSWEQLRPQVIRDIQIATNFKQNND
ncbi:hypothetical protein SAMN05660226_00619 [Parapedobacter luteus]|uniref:Glycosyl hydrolase family 20, domain 2 n=1 Tax=Parapedobacter luteus TaxID=623280 RepID=A0A1T5A675_9SPHI|nr:hypothetical protein [Parapedobacter luteus]SKB30359.1 hypothetical protein SAMN05660226_00619 [Parapedobacter luteus]